ncbi:chemotaxis protein CheX [Demequina mangrovi]|uniref:Chemotaxis phosphatase CheX n=1 Tax=Demequina mangrovi TaxID=1043493 RepID=A0A1H6ZQ96_9MICO|nr:chemotaxis protein CheX [Demequina mangrovi]SEJ55609.1 Chemotaxis phosphatase CheX [Demequina mangrovi]
MTATIDWAPVLAGDPLLQISQELFSTMIDLEPGLVERWVGDRPILDDPRYTWVDVAGEQLVRVVIGTGRETGEAITRALLGLPDGTPVSDEDYVDAVGEVANVVCGNVKSLVTHPGTLTIPVVAPAAPALEHGTCLEDACLSWRGAPITVALWLLP